MECRTLGCHHVEVMEVNKEEIPVGNTQSTTNFQDACHISYFSTLSNHTLPVAVSASDCIFHLAASEDLLKMCPKPPTTLLTWSHPSVPRGETLLRSGVQD